MTQAEGFGKRRLFEIMDDLEVKTRPILEAALAALSKDKGAQVRSSFAAVRPLPLPQRGAWLSGASPHPQSVLFQALEPWNRGYVLAGDTEKQQDPYFAFTNAVDAWGRSFAALGIDYK